MNDRIDAYFDLDLIPPVIESSACASRAPTRNDRIARAERAAKLRDAERAGESGGNSRPSPISRAALDEM